MMENNFSFGDLPQVRIRLVEQPVMVADRIIRSSQDAAELVSRELSGYDREVFCVLNLTARGGVINMNIVSVGDLNSSITHPREIFKSSILSNAGSLIAFHNHPSGDCTPSELDYDMTKRLVDAGELLGIPVIDHIVVGRDRSYSLRAHNELGKTYAQVQRMNRVYER